MRFIVLTLKAEDGKFRPLVMSANAVVAMSAHADAPDRESLVWLVGGRKPYHALHSVAAIKEMVDGGT
jgi:hypothetical protein